MVTTIDFIIFGLGAIFLLLYLILYFMGMKYNSYFDILDEKEYPLKEIYGIGYAALELIHYPFTGAKDRKLRQEINIFYDSKFEDYYLRVIRCQQITIAATILTAGFAMYGLLGEPAAELLIVMFAWAGYYYYGTLLDTKIKKRSESMMSDFSEIVSKLALLTNAGLILKEAWELVAYNGNTEIYQEMQKSVADMNNGVSEIDAISAFAARSMIPEIRKFSSTIIQGLTKGNSELTMMLQEQSSSVWELRQQLARREGEKASAKLLVPMMIMFIGVLLMIIVPIFANLGA